MGEHTPPVVYTVKEVADILSVSPDTVRRMIRRGDLGHIRLTRYVRITARQLHDYLDQQEQEASTDIARTA